MPEDKGVVTLEQAEFDEIQGSLTKATSTIDDLTKQLAEMKATDPGTRPVIGDPTAVSLDTKDHPVLKKGYLPPGAATSEQLKGINVNHFPQGDIDNFSMVRLMLAQAKSAQLGDAAYRRFAPWEKAYQEALEKANLGDQVSGQDGGFLAPEVWSSDFYDRLYPQMIIGQLPVTRIRMTARTQHFPALVNGATVYYTAENATITSSSPQFRQITLNAKKQSALTYISNELILDSTPDAEAVLRNNLMREMAIDKDKQILLGNGQSGAPTGLQNATNVVTTAMAGSHLVYTDLTNIIYLVEVLNNSTNVGVGQATCTGIVAAPILKKQIANLLDSNGRPLLAFGLGEIKLPANNDSIAGWLGVPKFVTSTIMPGTEGAQYVFAGDWQHLLVADRMDLEFMASNVAGTTFASDQTAVRVIHRYDTAVAHPEAFAVLGPVTS